MRIEVLGLGCPKCKKTKKLVEKALRDLELDAEVLHITDPLKIADYGVFITPGLVIDGEVKVSGRVPSIRQIKEFISGS